VSSTILCTVANTLFLTEFGAGHLPLIYLGLALFVPVLSFLYTATYARLSRVALAFAFAATFFALCIGGWVTHNQGGFHWFPYLLLLGWNAYSLVGLLIQGDQVQRLFNVREIKRANPTIMAGPIAGAILGGLMVGPLIAFLGTSADLLLVCGCLIPINLLLELHTIRQFPVLRKPAGHAATTKARPPLSLAQALRTRYVRLALFYGTCYGLTIRLIAFVFMSSADRFTDSPEELSHLLGICYSVGTAGSFVFVLFISTRLMNRFGLGASLAGSPIIIGPLIVGAMATAFVSGPDQPMFLWLMVGAYLLTHVLDSGTTTSALRTCLQALPVSERTPAETAARGLGKAIANGLAGISILLLQTAAGETVQAILVFTVAIGACWMLASRLLASDYAALLLRSINRRALRSTRVEIEDEHTLRILDQCLNGSNAEDVDLALHVLRDAEHPTYADRVMQLIGSERPLIAAMAIGHVESARLDQASELVDQALERSEHPAIQAAAIRACCAVHEADAIHTAVLRLDEPDLEVRAGAYAGLLRHCGIGGILAAGERLASIRENPDPDERRFAARVMGEVGEPGLYQLLLPLLSDEDPEVRRQALLAARRVRHARLGSSIIDALPDPDLRSSAMAALSEMGDLLLPILSAALADHSRCKSQVSRLLRVSAASQARGHVAVLKLHMDHPNEEVRHQILTTLSSLDYAATPEEAPAIRQMIEDEVEHGFRLLQIEASVGTASGYAPFHRALEFEFFLRRERVFLLLSFLVEPQMVTRASDTLLHGSSSEQAVALETLELTLPPDLRKVVLPLVNTEETLPRRLHRLEQHFAPMPGDINTFVPEIIADRDGFWSYSWTRVWAIRAAVSLEIPSATTAVRSCLNDDDSTVRTVAAWAMASIETWTGSAAPHTPSQDGPLSPQELEDPMLLTIEKLNILHQVELFADTPDYALVAVAAIAEEIDVPQGETFVHRGTQGDAMFVVVSGEARIHIDDETLTHAEPGESFGETVIFDPGPRFASATATKDLVLLSIGKRAFQEAISDRPEIAQATLRVLARRIRFLANGAEEGIHHRT